MALSPGTRLGPYEVVSLLGRGGMGEVWKAVDSRVDRAVALKVLPGDFFEGEERRPRFAREAKLLASLNHPGIATLYAFEEIPGFSPVLVMELVEGESLAARIKKGPVPVREALALARDIASALEAAHGKRQAPTATATGTETGVILGTAAYMSPEQARGQRVDARTDVWALGVVLWEMLAGRRLFRSRRRPRSADFFHRASSGIPGGASRARERPGNCSKQPRLGDSGDASRSAQWRSRPR